MEERSIQSYSVLGPAVFAATLIGLIWRFTFGDSLAGFVYVTAWSGVALGVAFRVMANFGQAIARAEEAQKRALEGRGPRFHVVQRGDDE